MGSSPLAAETAGTFGRRVSEHPGSRRNLTVRGEQDHGSLLVGHPEHQHLALEARDALGREVHDRYQLLSEKSLRGVVSRDLGAAPLHPDLRSEVDRKLYRRLAGFRKRLGLHHPSDPDVYLFKVCPGDLLHATSRIEGSYHEQNATSLQIR